MCTKRILFLCRKKIFVLYKKESFFFYNGKSLILHGKISLSVYKKRFFVLYYKGIFFLYEKAAPTRTSEGLQPTAAILTLSLGWGLPPPAATSEDPWSGCPPPSSTAAATLLDGMRGCTPVTIGVTLGGVDPDILPIHG